LPESAVTIPEWPVTLPGIVRRALDFFNLFGTSLVCATTGAAYADQEESNA
jgi:hypothetical protein